MDIFHYNTTTETYEADWEDCHLSGSDVGYDDRAHFLVSVRATLPSGTLLNHKRLKIFDTWACQDFSKECDARPEAQMKMRQYLTQFGDWVQQQVRATAQYVNGMPPSMSAMPLVLPHAPPPLLPPLPRQALLDDSLALDAAPWLEEYCTHSRRWAPRAAQGFHEAVGLWMLSTVAARRLCVEVGSPLYPVLFLALVAPSTLYTKTTAARTGREGLVDAGCACFLASDRSTPQALLKSMSGRVPDDYGGMSENDQLMIRKRIAFAAQRGWYFEEWGGMLQQMTRRDSPMAEFHGLLRVLDDGYSTFTTETIQRGLEHVDAPSLSLLASATPHDLGRFMEPGSAWWHDGFWPRFALIVPGPEELPSRAKQPWGSARLPASLLLALHAWHERLGIPEVTIEPGVDSKGKQTGEWKATRSPLPLQILDVSAGVKEAYEQYNDGLTQLLTNGDAPEDLFACYGRFHTKALRIAVLVASLQQQSSVHIQHWAYAQQVVERWRMMLHQVVTMVGDSYATSREEQFENKIESLVAKDGPRTARELQQYIKGSSSGDFARALAAMTSIGRLVAYQVGKTKRYGLPIDVPQSAEDDGEQNGIPF